jgi:hypothetical protein
MKTLKPSLTTAAWRLTPDRTVVTQASTEDRPGAEACDQELGFPCPVPGRPGHFDLKHLNCSIVCMYLALMSVGLRLPHPPRARPTLPFDCLSVGLKCVV